MVRIFKDNQTLFPFVMRHKHEAQQSSGTGNAQVIQMDLSSVVFPSVVSSTQDGSGCGQLFSAQSQSFTGECSFCLICWQGSVLCQLEEFYDARSGSTRAGGGLSSPA